MSAKRRAAKQSWQAETASPASLRRCVLSQARVVFPLLLHGLHASVDARCFREFFGRFSRRRRTSGARAHLWGVAPQSCLRVVPETRYRLRIAAVAVLFIVGCAKFNRAYDPSEGTTGAGPAEETSATSGEPAGGTRAPGSETTDGGSMRDTSSGTGSADADGSTGAGGRDGSSTEAGSDGGAWPCALVGDTAALPPCDGVLSAESACTVRSFAFDDEFHCRRDFWARVEIEGEAGAQLVFGTPDVAGAQVTLVGVDGVIDPCSPMVGDAVFGRPFLGEVELRQNQNTSATLVVRDAVGLCDVPAGCCTPGGACGDDGLRACVVEGDPVCDRVWDDVCISRAMLWCGANCI